MFTIVKNRGEGKTTELINLASQLGCPIVCGNSLMAKYTKQKSELLEKPIETLSFEQFINQRNHGKHYDKVLMDEILCCLSNVYPEILVGTMSEQPMPSYEMLFEFWVNHHLKL